MTTAAAAEAAGERRARYVEGGCIAHPARVGERADMEDERAAPPAARTERTYTLHAHIHTAAPSVRGPPENRLPCMQPSQEEQPRAAGAWPSASGRGHKARRVLCELLVHSRAQVLCIRSLRLCTISVASAARVDRRFSIDDRGRPLTCETTLISHSPNTAGARTERPRLLCVSLSHTLL